MLAEKVEKHGTSVWLINTGWTGGSYGTGYRFKLRHTRVRMPPPGGVPGPAAPCCPPPPHTLAHLPPKGAHKRGDR